MSKIKIRCIQCNKSFKSTNPKQQICPECEEKARREHVAKSKGLLSTSNTPTPALKRIPPPKPAANPTAIAAQPKQHWLDQHQDIKIATPEPPESARPPRLDAPERRRNPAHPTVANDPRPGDKVHSAPPSAQHQAPHEKHAGYKGTAPTTTGLADHKAIRRPDWNKRSEGGKAAKDGKPIAASKPKREPRQPTPPFAPTPEQIAAIEQRYLELAQPEEFNGIRTQISKELGIPKSAVKQIVHALRGHQGLPSWWDVQSYHGSSEDLEKIRAAYLPFLPLPPVGVHKQLAELLNMPPGMVYQAVKVIRAEMSLPQYNPPEAHGMPVMPMNTNDSPGNTVQPTIHEGL